MVHASASRGLTLLELMIALAVVGLLASLAYPSYAAQLRKARRAEAQQVLMDAALRQHQILLDTRAYAATLADTGLVLPQALEAHYAITLEVDAGPVPAFTLTATPRGDQAADACGALSLDQANVRLPAACW